MKLISRYIINLNISHMFTVLSSLSLLLILIKVEESKEFLMMIISSLIFWLCLIGEQAFLWYANKQRKEIERSIPDFKVQGLPGICSVFKTLPGMISDIVFAVSTVIYVILLIGKWGENDAQYVFLFLMVLSFRLHCVANGKNYRYKQYLHKRRAKL